MASQQISIKQSVYNRLKQIKQHTESFSDVIDRLLDSTSNTQNILSLYGVSKSNESTEDSLILDSYANSQKEIRKLFRSRFD